MIPKDSECDIGKALKDPYPEADPEPAADLGPAIVRAAISVAEAMSQDTDGRGWLKMANGSRVELLGTAEIMVYRALRREQNR